MKMLTNVLGAKTLTRDFPKTYFIMTENMINHRGGGVVVATLAS